MRIVGILVVLLGLMMGIGSNLPTFIDPPSILIVVTFTLGALWFSGASIPAMARSIMPGELTTEQQRDAASAWALATRASVAAGVIGILVGAVIMLRNLDDISQLGPGVAICILTAFYGLLVAYGLCDPCRRYVEAAGR